MRVRRQSDLAHLPARRESGAIGDAARTWRSTVCTSAVAIRGRPLSDRRQALEDVIGDSHHVYAARRLHADGLEAWAEVKQRGYEGLIAKRDASLYHAGPTRDWLKVKVRHEGRFVVVGLDVPLAGACSLLLAARVGTRLRYVGRVECGVSRRLVAELRERCTILSTPVCADAT